MLATLKKRKDFLFVASGEKASGRFLLLQARNFQTETNIFFGITASKKTGNAVKRNRIKRRLRIAFRECLPKYGIKGKAYVAIARASLYDAKWQDLRNDLENLIKRLSKKEINSQRSAIEIQSENNKSN